jgi:hypothetical protein
MSPEALIEERGTPGPARPRPSPRALTAERCAEQLLESLGLRAAPVPVELIALRLGLPVLREREANAIAGAPIMPERLVMQAVTHLRADVEDESVIAELARHFEVSRQAMTFRVANLMSGMRR